LERGVSGKRGRRVWKWGGRVVGGGIEGTYMPTMPTFLPGPMPFRTSGEYAVSPAHSMGAASSDARPSGMGNVKCSWARMCDE
jgi:hypothetical protein